MYSLIFLAVISYLWLGCLIYDYSFSPFPILDMLRIKYLNAFYYIIIVYNNSLEINIFSLLSILENFRINYNRDLLDFGLGYILKSSFDYNVSLDCDFSLYGPLFIDPVGGGKIDISRLCHKVNVEPKDDIRYWRNNWNPTSEIDKPDHIEIHGPFKLKHHHIDFVYQDVMSTAWRDSGYIYKGLPLSEQIGWKRAINQTLFKVYLFPDDKVRYTVRYFEIENQDFCLIRHYPNTLIPRDRPNQFIQSTLDSHTDIQKVKDYHKKTNYLGFEDDYNDVLVELNEVITKTELEESIAKSKLELSVAKLKREEARLKSELESIRKSRR